MESIETNNWYPRLWGAWKTGLVAVVTVLLVGMGITLAERVLLITLGRNDIGYLGWIAFFACVWGGLGIGSSYFYLRSANVDASFKVARPTRMNIPLMGALLSLVVGIFTLGAIVLWVWTDAVPGHPFAFLGTVIGAFPGGTLESWSQYFESLAFMAMLLALFVGPAIAVQIHGVIQNTVTEIATPEVGIIVATMSLAVPLAVGAAGTPSIGTFLIVSMIVAASGYVYERTGNLFIPIVAYGVAAGLGLLVTSLPLVQSLYETFGTTLP